MFELNDRVAIIGGSLLPDWEVSLDGVQGQVASSDHLAPPNTVAVWIDWASSHYAHWAEELPKTINVPPDKLRKVEPPKPKLRML
ncbi:MAG: hypothetical protein JWN98_1768 [Abditibacteriota bacterium]|nr:hypothetical protein [Abditibacteriota bacterium]